MMWEKKCSRIKCENQKSLQSELGVSSSIRLDKRNSSKWPNRCRLFLVYTKPIQVTPLQFSIVKGKAFSLSTLRCRRKNRWCYKTTSLEGPSPVMVLLQKLISTPAGSHLWPRAISIHPKRSNRKREKRFCNTKLILGNHTMLWKSNIRCVCMCVVYVKESAKKNLY